MNKTLEQTEKKDYSYTPWFGSNLAELLADKILSVYNAFNSKEYNQSIENQHKGKSYKQLVELHADCLYKYLPSDYEKSINIIIQTLGEENPNETGMFKVYYWILPYGKLVEKYGLNHFDISIKAIEEITKRNTGEYTIRPFIRKYPKQTFEVMKKWAQSPNFHLRRLASEGLRPKLPWATKLDEFIDEPQPVFELLDLLMEDEVRFVKKSVGNHIADYLKVNKNAAIQFISKYQSSQNIHTQWILKHATRKIKLN